MSRRPGTAKAGGAPWGRFDDLIAGTGLLFTEAHQVLAAHVPEEVAPVVAAVERATQQGFWAFGYLGYEAAGGLDPGLAVGEPAPGDPPLAWFALSRRPAPVAPAAPPPGAVRSYTAEPWTLGWTPDRYRGAVERVRAYIAAGDTYQCNLAGELRSVVHGDLEQFYADLAWNQRGRYAAYLDLERHVVVSASPELFFEWSGDTLLSRPMKGTARRGRTAAEDQERLQLLRASPKERAENVIVVDLLRNDVSRVAATGSVNVPRLCVPECYETVWQLTSDVTATVRPGTGLLDVLRALFPCGSVTGAPKQRTMEIIRELEDGPRGVYCGAIGVLAPPEVTPRARFSVAIRTAVVDRATGGARYGTGSGITWASDADAEFAELHAKAAILGAPFRERP